MAPGAAIEQSSSAFLRLLETMDVGRRDKLGLMARMIVLSGQRRLCLFAVIIVARHCSPSHGTGLSFVVPACAVDKDTCIHMMKKYKGLSIEQPVYVCFKLNFDPINVKVTQALMYKIGTRTS